ncbi:MAG: 2-oxoglutarate dehydrogenase complex dihydrolipoyllysine-residue succinyltransferase [Gammaproteobacteria bacterium]
MAETIEVKVPTLPESVADATVSAWHKKEGDTVNRDENLVDIETDKVVLEVPATTSGVITKILKPTGTTVGRNEVLAIITPGAVASAPKPETKTEAPAPAKAEAPAPEVSKPASAELSPSVRRAAGELGIDATQIPGSGKGGRVTKEDVQKHAQAPMAVGARTEERVPMSRLRARIAERLLDAQQNMAILTTFNEINMKAVMDLRAQYKDQFEKAHKIRLGFMSFFVRAAVAALKRFPDVNAYIDGTDIIYHAYADIGVAVSSDRGLVVPVLRNAEQMSMAQVEAQIAEFGQKAKEGKLTLEEMTGGTFTISNGGVFGSLMSTPILNPPQSAILGLHKIEERPVAENGQVVIRPMMYVALSYDHRIIDGKDSVQFLKTIKELIEDPARLILDV